MQIFSFEIFEHKSQTKHQQRLSLFHSTMLTKLFIIFFVATFVNCQWPDHIDDVAFIKLGSYREYLQIGCSLVTTNFVRLEINKTETKSYYIPRHVKALWSHTRSICTSHGMDAVSLETKAEEQNFLVMCYNNAALFDQWTHIGGISLVAKSTTSWFWVNSGNRISYPMAWMPDQPDFGHGNPLVIEYCLSIGKMAGNVFGFNDINCFGYNEFKFICQRSTRK